MTLLFVGTLAAAVGGILLFIVSLLLGRIQVRRVDRGMLEETGKLMERREQRLRQLDDSSAEESAKESKA